jgi:hypothetical protein
MPTTGRKRKLNLIERLPRSYQEFFINEKTHLINGLPLFDFEVDGEMQKMTIILQAMRPDLRPDYIPMRIMDSRLLCLDVSGSAIAPDDAPMVEIDIERIDPPRKVHPSFRSYYQDCKRFEKYRDGVLRRLKRHLQYVGQNYDHNRGGQLPRSKEWRPIRSCVHDLVVGLALIRHDEHFNGLDVGEFICTDHPSYQPGHGVRALALLLLSDAYRNGATMTIRFTRYDGRAKKRVFKKIPMELMELARHVGVKIVNDEDGIITHEQSIELYSALVGLSPAVRKEVEPHFSRGAFSLPGLCYLISSKVWSLEEASWILLNANRPEGVLFGVDKPEDRLKFLDSIYYGRAAVLAGHLHQRLIVDQNQAGAGCIIEVIGSAWIYRPAHSIALDWTAGNNTFTVHAQESIAVFPNPHPIMPMERNRIVGDIKQIMNMDLKDATKNVLYGAECREIPDIEKIAEAAEKKSGVRVLIAPFPCREIDQKVERRMSRARMVRR